MTESDRTDDSDTDGIRKPRAPRRRQVEVDEARRERNEWRRKYEATKRDRDEARAEVERLRSANELCPRCGKASASYPAEVYCVECSTTEW